MRPRLVSAASIGALLVASGQPAASVVIVAAPEPPGICAQAIGEAGDAVAEPPGECAPIADPGKAGNAGTALPGVSPLTPDQSDALPTIILNPWAASFTGPADRTADAGTAFPRVPLGAAPGAPPDNDFASPVSGAWHWAAWQKALAIGVERVAPLIGSIGNDTEVKPGGSVFVAKVSDTGKRPQLTNELLPTSTSSATMTVIPRNNAFTRAGSLFAVPASTDPGQGLPVANPSAPPVPTYRYAPQPAPSANEAQVAASFAGNIRASGPAELVYDPVRPVQPPSSDPARTAARLLDVTQPIGSSEGATLVDGTRRFISTSVAANPGLTAARYIASLLATSSSAGSTGLPGPGLGDPTPGDLLAGTGPLNNELALP